MAAEKRLNDYLVCAEVQPISPLGAFDFVLANEHD
jgi:hypothetical protein